MNFLIIDTSGPNMKIALSINGKEVFYENDKVFKHIENLLPAINNCIEKIKENKRNINYIGVCEGPGSFTGIRIGISTVMGLAYFSNIKYFGFSVFDVYKYLYSNLNDSVVIPVIDAKRNKYYCSFISGSNPIKYFDISEDEIIEKLSKINNKDYIFVGEDVVKLSDSFRNKIKFSIKSEKGYNSKDLLKFAKFFVGNSFNIKSPKPIYLRKSEAENNILKRKKN